MTLPHEDTEFGDLLRIVSEENSLSTALVEKDYWITHSLWSLQQAGFSIWLKGGTSLSKGFGIIQRFSEDLDLKVEPGSANLPVVKSWTSMNKGPVATRRDFFDALEEILTVSGASVKLDRARMDEYARSADYKVYYPGHFTSGLPRVMSPFVRLEIGTARVTPSLPRTIDSFVHNRLRAKGQLSSFTDNRPTDLRCVHPLVTLVEKVDAIGRRFARGASPETFIRHYEDAANIICAESDLPTLDGGLSHLVQDMLAERQIVPLLKPDDHAVSPQDAEWLVGLDKAYEATAPMYWGNRISLDDSCAFIREWLARL